MDTIAIIDSASIERMSLLNADASFLLLEEGRKTEALEISTHCGGGAINAAVSFARLGCRCAVLAKLGQDRRAEHLLACLDAEGISARWIARDANEPTGASVLVSSHERNAAVFTFRGANTRLSSNDLRDDAFECDLVYIANLSNEAASVFPSIVTKAKAAGAKVAANPGLRQLSGHGAAFRDCLREIDVLALNRQEADAVLPLIAFDTLVDGPIFGDGQKVPPLAARGLRYEGRTMSLRAFFNALLRRGVGCVLLTDGRNGAFAASRHQVIYCAALDAQVAGTAGAGDAFASTFSAFIVSGRPVSQALRAATLNAAAVLGHVDTQSGLLKRRDIEAHLDQPQAVPHVLEWVM